MKPRPNFERLEGMSRGNPEYKYSILVTNHETGKAVRHWLKADEWEQFKDAIIPEVIVPSLMKTVDYDPKTKAQ